MSQSSQSSVEPPVIQLNNEAVSLIRRGEYSEAKRELTKALQDLRSEMTLQGGPQPNSASNNGVDSSSVSLDPNLLSVDQWMIPSIEALHADIDEAATRSYFLYTKGVPIPPNLLFMEGQLHDVYFTAAIASVIFFNQALACHLDHIQQTESESSSPLVPENASELYRMSIQCARHISQEQAPNANFLMAAMNNLAVLERMRDLATNLTVEHHPTKRRNQAKQYFETLRRLLQNCRPSSPQSPDDILWNYYVGNVVRGLGLGQSVSSSTDNNHNFATAVAVQHSYTNQAMDE